MSAPGGDSRALLVLGAHRSGTSALAGELVRLGDDILASKSWRWTAPLRAILGLFKRKA